MDLIARVARRMRRLLEPEHLPAARRVDHPHRVRSATAISGGSAGITASAEARVPVSRRGS
ncbi:hypothetical protein [Amycolatopsis thermophila]|uniref:Uncharacterized protein n=1 Tax=Amycolatopsis thermophila TaxID=206084 RepID=A0ABU0EN72_9PSEU|nr:hypothetical protein [Amycolatopsis thermophila]MDQ0376744.1 hypothetical protein [Amycolatopsis thermophila]